MIKQLLIALDQLFNVFIRLNGHFGMADETLSARVYRLRNDSKVSLALMRFINTIFFWQANHCKESFESELNRKHLPRDYRSQA